MNRSVIGAFIGLAAWAAQFGCSRSAQSYLERANRYYSEGKYEEASLNYRNSLKQNPRFAEAHYRLGLAESKQGHQSDAYQELRQATDLAPNRDDIQIALADLALVAYNLDPDKPTALYEQVAKTAEYLLREDPNSFDGHRLRADVLVLDGKFEEALGIFQKANKLRPHEPNVTIPMTQVLFRLNRSDEAERFARESLAARSDVGPLYDVLLNYYILKNRSADAEALLKSKIKALPRDSSSVLQLAALYQRMHREAEMTETLKSLVDARKQFPDGHALVGDFYASLRRWSEAQGEYSAGLKAASRKDKILYQKKIVKALVGEGKRGDAVEKLDQLLKTDPSDAESRIARAILLRESNDPKRLDFAISELNAVVGQDPSNQVVRYNLGLAYLSKGDLQGARAQLSESARLNRSAVAPRVALGELAMRMRNYPEAIRLADEVLALDQSNSTAKLWRVAGLLGSKAYGQARTELDGLLREYPDSLNVNLHAAVLDAAEKKYNAAELRYLRFYKPGQQDLRPLEGLVQLYTEQRQADRGLKLIDNELKQSPDSTPLHLLLASTAIKAGKLDLAAEQYEWLRSKDPNSELAYSSLGDVYQLKGDVNNALKSYEKAREFAPNDPRIIAIIAYLQQTTPGQNSEAIVNLRKELALDPENTVAMNNLAFALADTGNDLDQALSLAEKAQKKAPGNGGIADTLGWVYTKKGLNDSAIQIFIGLVRKYPDDPTVRYHYAVALLQKGQTDEAKAEFVISLSKNPPKDMADKIKQILSKVG